MEQVNNRKAKDLVTKVLLFYLFTFLPLTVVAQVPLLQNVQAYEGLSLNGDWHYIVDVQEEGYYDYRMSICSVVGFALVTTLKDSLSNSLVFLS